MMNHILGGMAVMEYALLAALIGLATLAGGHTYAIALAEEFTHIASSI